MYISAVALLLAASGASAKAVLAERAPALFNRGTQQGWSLQSTVAVSGLTSCGSDAYCPSSLTCNDAANDEVAACCSSSSDCRGEVEGSPKCADDSWNLYSGYMGNGFCCEAGKVGAYDTSKSVAGECVDSVGSLQAAVLTSSGTGAAATTSASSAASTSSASSSASSVSSASTASITSSSSSSSSSASSASAESSSSSSSSSASSSSAESSSSSASVSASSSASKSSASAKTTESSATAKSSSSTASATSSSATPSSSGTIASTGGAETLGMSFGLIGAAFLALAL